MMLKFAKSGLDLISMSREISETELVKLIPNFKFNESLHKLVLIVLGLLNAVGLDDAHCHCQRQETTVATLFS